MLTLFNIEETVTNLSKKKKCRGEDKDDKNEQSWLREDRGEKKIINEEAFNMCFPIHAMLGSGWCTKAYKKTFVLKSLITLWYKT